LNKVLAERAKVFNYYLSSLAVPPIVKWRRAH